MHRFEIAVMSSSGVEGLVSGRGVQAGERGFILKQGLP
jgi:hypothetical protein